MKICKTDKHILSFKKEGIKEFLNGLTSNTMDATNNAFLTLHGRIVATFDQLQVHEDEFLVLVEPAYIEPLLVHLDRYLKLAGVQLTHPDGHVYFDLENSLPLETGDYAIEQSKGKLVITHRELDSTVTPEDFCLFRLDNHIPIQGIDYHDEMLLNVSTTDFVSFTKGCFLGQEPISKVHNRSKPTWRLIVKEEAHCTDEERKRMTSRVKSPNYATSIGFVFEKNE